MLLRRAVLAAILVSGTAAVAAAQSDQFPFRRFATRNWNMSGFELRPGHFMTRNHFSMRDQERLRAGAERLRIRLQDQSRNLGERFRSRAFDWRAMAPRLRERGFALRGQEHGNRMEFRFRDMDRMRERMRSRMDHFRFERPMMRRRSGAI